MSTQIHYLNSMFRPLPRQGGFGIHTFAERLTEVSPKFPRVPMRTDSKPKSCVSQVLCAHGLRGLQGEDHWS